VFLNFFTQKKMKKGAGVLFGRRERGRKESVQFSQGESTFSRTPSPTYLHPSGENFPPWEKKEEASREAA